MGTRDSIGVFLWSTLSMMNTRVGRAANGILDIAGVNETLSAALNMTNVDIE